jgi:hypothetical protein
MHLITLVGLEGGLTIGDHYFRGLQEITELLGRRYLNCFRHLDCGVKTRCPREDLEGSAISRLISHQDEEFAEPFRRQRRACQTYCMTRKIPFKTTGLIDCTVKIEICCHSFSNNFIANIGTLYPQFLTGCTAKGGTLSLILD